MKSQNQISHKILALALLLIASCEVWAVNFGQSQSNPLLIQTHHFEDRDNHNIIDFNSEYKPMLYNGKGITFHASFCYDENIYRFYFLKRINEDLKRFKTNLKDKFQNDLLKITNQIVSNGTGGGDWNSTSTWAGGKIPQSGDEVIVSEGDKLVINSDVYVNSLVLKTNAVVRSDSWARRIVINKDLKVSDSASIISNFGSGKLDCYITAANDGQSLISIAQTAKVSFENLKILGETFFEKGNIDVMNFSAIKQKDFIAKTGTVLNIGQKK